MCWCCIVCLQISGEALQNVDSWSFDCFQLNEVSEGHALKYVGLELFSRYRFLDRYKVPLSVKSWFLFDYL